MKLGLREKNGSIHPLRKRSRSVFSEWVWGPWWLQGWRKRHYVLRDKTFLFYEARREINTFLPSTTMRHFVNISSPKDDNFNPFRNKKIKIDNIDRKRSPSMSFGRRTVRPCVVPPKLQGDPRANAWGRNDPNSRLASPNQQQNLSGLLLGFHKI